MKGRKYGLILPLIFMLAFSGLLGTLSLPGAPGIKQAAAEQAPQVAAQSFSANITSVQDIPDFTGMHPRLFIMPDQVDGLRSRITNDPEAYDEWHLIANSNSSLAKAFQYMISEEESLGRAAITEALTALVNLSDSNREGQGRSAMSIFLWTPLVYDWCYPLLTEQEKQQFIAEFIKFAQYPDKPPGYPIDQGAMTLTSHHVEGWFWYQLIIGLAIYDESPQMWEDAIDFFFNHHQIANNFGFASGLHHQGAGYLGTRFIHPVLFSVLMHQLTGGGQVFDSTQLDMAYQHIYHLRPDGEMVRSGDMSTHSGLEEFKVTLLQQMANLFQDEYLYHAAQHYNSRDAVMETILDLVTRKQELGGKESLNGLPLVQYFPEPTGSEMVARSSWEIGDKASDDYLVQMRIGKYMFGNHQHYDMGTFQIYYQGALTGDSGTYRGSTADYGTDHWRHYYRSAIAHNGLIIYNPNQEDGVAHTDPQNDGGIRFPRTSGDWQPSKIEDLTNPRNGYDVADMLAQGTDEENGKYNYAYISGDLTKGFKHTYDPANPDRAEKVTRSMVTMPTKDADHPLSFFVFDRVHATDASYAKKFIMHTADAPVIEGNRVVSSAARSNDGYAGELTSWTLLPKNPVIQAVEGYKVGYGDQEREYDPGTVNDAAYEEFSYRLEVSNATESKVDRFLHAMTVSGDGQSTAAEAKLIESGNTVGAQLLGNNVIFSKDGIQMSSAEFQLTGEGTQSVLVTDLNAGTYLIDRIDRTPGDFMKYAEVTAECSCLYFEGNPGHYVVTRGSIDEQIAERLIRSRGGDQTAPEVSISGGPSLGVINGTAQLTAAASDNVGVAGVQFLLDGKKLGSELSSAPYTMEWNSSTWADGTYSLTAIARDAAGHYRESAAAKVTIHNEPGFLPLHESFETDAAGTVFTEHGGTWKVLDGKYRLDAEQGMAVHQRQFSGDYELSVDAVITSVRNGERGFQLVFDYEHADSYRYVLLSEDESQSGIYGYAAGRAEKLAELSATVIPGALYKLKLNRVGSFVDVYLDGAFIGQAQQLAQADAQVGLGSMSSMARFDNLSVKPMQGGAEQDTEPPEVVITHPADGTTVSGVVDLKAEAEDNQMVAGVQFMLDGEPLGAEVTSAPYEADWNTAAITDGVYTLTARARDMAGNQKISEPITVTVVNSSVLYAVITVEPATTAADGMSEVSVQVQLMEEGEALTSSAGELTLASTLGMIGSVTDHEDGTYSAVLTAPTEAGVAVISAQLEGEAIGGTASVTFTAVDEEPGVTAVITVDPATAAADGMSEVSVQVQLMEEGEALTSSAGELTLASTLGMIGNVTDHEDGTYSAVLTAPTEAGVAVLSAQLEGEAIGGTAMVTFTAVDEEPGVTAVITASPNSAFANGTSQIRLAVRLLDEEGVQLEASAGVLSLTSTLGTLGSITDHEDGTYSAILTAPTSAGTAVISARLNGEAIEGTATVTFTVYSPPIYYPPTPPAPPKPVEPIVETATELGIEVKLQAEALAELLKELSSGETFVMQTEEAAQQYDFVVPLAAWNQLRQHSLSTIIELRTPLAAYQLPLGVIDREVLKQQQLAGEEWELIVTLKPVNFAGQWTTVDAEMIAPLIAFDIVLKAGEHSISLNQFGSTYVNRTIYLEEDALDPAHSTGVVFDPESGEMRFVPTVFHHTDGRWEAIIKRTSNSVYTVITSHRSFDDITGHWAAEDIEMLASKRIVSGMTEERFDLNSSLTRAQFTALVVRSLGMDEAQAAEVSFTDIPDDAWYAGAVYTASQAGLIGGYNDGTFRPNQAISREELAVILGNTLTYLGKLGKAVEGPVQQLLYTDAVEVSAWAVNAVSAVTEAGLMQGRVDLAFAPKGITTRAEASVVIRRLLQYVEFIN